MCDFRDAQVVLQAHACGSSFGDDVGRPGGLLDAVQRDNSDIIKQLKPSQEVVCFLAACVHGSPTMAGTGMASGWPWLSWPWMRPMMPSPRGRSSDDAGVGHQ